MCEEFSIVPLNEDDLDKMGIYIIWFGHKFYIGATQNSFNRIIGHNKTILSRFDDICNGKNSVSNIVQHLKQNTFIKTGFFQLLQICDTEIELVDAEHDWLCGFIGDKNCLNYSFKVHRTIKGIIVRPNGDFSIKKGAYGIPY